MDADTVSKIANLPWNLQIVIGSGYLSYLLAYVGLRHHHKAIDAFFLSMVFGLIALLSISLTISLPIPARLVIAVIASATCAVLWRAIGRNTVRKFFRDRGYSWADDTISAWDHLLESNKNYPSQITVETQDGWQFFCTDTARVGDLPHGPFVIGTTGDVLMYADHSKGPGEDHARPAEDMILDTWGANITYLPATQVRRVMIRYIPTSEKVEAESWAAKVVRKVGLKRRHRAKVPAPGE